MSDSLLDDAGPEGRNARGAAFEDQLAAMGETLGWKLICRNVDVYLKGRTPSRGIDLLWAIHNPRIDEAEGWVQEGKNHERQAASALQTELQTLHDKVARLHDSEQRKEHHHVGPAFKDLVGGILCHRSENYQPARTRDALLGLDLRNRERGRRPTRLAFYGTDTLEALADAFNRFGEPAVFYWPPTARAAGCWHRGCPPEQLAAGLLAYRNQKQEVVLWLRDTLTHHDVTAISAVARSWGIAPHSVVCSELDRDQWRLVADQWRDEAKRSESREHGKLPERVEPRNLSYAKPNAFDDQWPIAA